MDELIRSVIKTMDTISICGRDNMDKFVGCINALQSVVDALESCKNHNNKANEEVTADG